MKNSALVYHCTVIRCGHTLKKDINLLFETNEIHTGSVTCGLVSKINLAVNRNVTLFVRSVGWLHVVRNIFRPYAIKSLVVPLPSNFLL